MTTQTPWRSVYVGNGVQRDFQIPTNTIRRAHIAATVDGVAAPFVFLTDTIIRFAEAPADEAEVVITRTPPVEEAIHAYEENTLITSKALNENQRQTLQITERALWADDTDHAEQADEALEADNADQAGRLTPGARINGVLFDGTEDINIFADGENATFADEAGSANRLRFNRTINGVVFNGTSNITITADPTAYKEANTVYVGPGGVDDWDTHGYAREPFATIEFALQEITDRDLTGWTVMLLGGSYEIDGNLVVPPYTTVQGQNFQRRTIIRPTTGNENNNAFLVNAGVHLVNLKFTGWQVDDLENPTGGFAMAFAPGAIILPGGVPYGQNCVVTSAVTEPLVASPDDFENGNPAFPEGGGCVLADASVLSGYTQFPNIMTWGFTPASPNGIGYVAKNGAHINCVNAIGVGARIHFMAQDGGNLVLSGCSSQFGDYSLWSEGSAFEIRPLHTDPGTTDPAGVSKMAAIKANLVADALAYTSGLRAWTPEQLGFIETDLGLLADAVGLTVQFGNDEPMINIMEGFFDFTGVSYMPFADYTDWKFSFDDFRARVNSLAGFSAGTQAYVDALFARIVDTFDNYFFQTGEGPEPDTIEPVRFRLRSLVTAIGHQWTAPLAGVNYFKVPPAKRARAIQRSIVQKDGGKVKFSGQDDEGNAVFVGGLTISARSGELGGPPFDQAIRTRVTRNVIARTY